MAWIGLAAETTDGLRMAVEVVPARLLAETVVAVRHTLGTGGEEDNRALDQLERLVWLELRFACAEERERQHWIGQAKGTLATPGAPSCQHAARLLTRTAGWLQDAGERRAAEERERMERCAERCTEGAARLESIAREMAGA